MDCQPIRLAALCWNGEGSFLFTSSSAPYDCNDNGLCDEVGLKHSSVVLSLSLSLSVVLIIFRFITLQNHVSHVLGMDLSICLVHGIRFTSMQDTPVVPIGRSPRTDVLLKAENVVLEFGGSVVRLAGLYISFSKLSLLGGYFYYVYYTRCQP